MVLKLQIIGIIILCIIQITVYLYTSISLLKPDDEYSHFNNRNKYKISN